MRRDDLSIYLAILALALGTLLPLAVVLPFGWLWLWQNDYLLYWMIGALLLTLTAFAGRAWLMHHLAREPKSGPATSEAGSDLSPREKAAFDAVEKIAADIDLSRLTDRQQALAIGVEAVDAVAREMHPGTSEAVWNFTVPELLMLIEQVSARLRPLVRDAVPLGDRLTVRQMLAIYRWRGLVTTAERAYDLWRIIRLANPIAASTQELRERMSRAVIDELREELAKRIARLYVREVGRAAIDLYSGRMRLSDIERDAFVSPETAADRAARDAAGNRPAEPLRFLVAGQTGVGKSSLINALSREVRAVVDVLPQEGGFHAYEVQREGMPEVFLIDSPGLGDDRAMQRLADQAMASDLVIWVVAANRADRDRDRRARGVVRDRFAAVPERRPPAALVVATQIDRLRPFGEWAPPYDIASGDSPKARSIRDAIDAIAEDLGADPDAIVPVAIPADGEPYNVDLVWGRLAERLDAAKAAQLLRCVGDTGQQSRFKRVLDQAVAGGRIAARWLAKDGAETRPPDR